MSATQHAWPLDRLGAALSALAESHGLIGEPGGASFMLADPLRETDDQAAIGAWLEHRAALLGAELEPTYVEVGELAHSLPRLGPAILLIRNEGEPTRALALLPSSGSSVRVLGPDLKAHRIRVDVVARALAESRLATRRAECESVLAAVNIPERRRVAATEALLQRRCANLAVQGIWQLRLPPSAPLGAQLRRDGAARSLTISIIAHLAHYLLLLGAWWVIGRSILQGRSDLGWLIAWALLLLSIVPLRALQSWHTGLTALRVGAIIKRRLLAGALALEPDEIRTRGIGRLLALVIESSAVESLAISTGFASVSAIVDLTMAAWVLGQGAGGPLLALAMWVWLLLVGVLGWRYAVQRFAWARRRLDMTHALVERMVGHTTRLAQEPPSRWHEGEDAATSAYLGSSRAMDRLAVMLRATATRGWILVAVIGLWPVLVGGATSTTTLAIALGGVLLAQTAFVRFAGGVVDLVDLMVAWGEVRSLSATAARGQGLRSRFFRPKPEAGQRPSDPDAQPVIEARELGYRYPGRERPVLRECDLRIVSGERLLLEGPSGGGKSTLAALLTGLREPDTGLLLLDGLDRPTHGELGWRARVAAAPQFHQNHVLTNTFAFNLLMGRRWPPQNEDVELAQAICNELGLGPLLERMPAGMLQNVGETGWQLSHGERSRLYLARALLQGAELVILDESLAALDPENQGKALACAFERAPTLLVIAHP